MCLLCACFFFFFFIQMSYVAATLGLDFPGPEISKFRPGCSREPALTLSRLQSAAIPSYRLLAGRRRRPPCRWHFRSGPHPQGS